MERAAQTLAVYKNKAAAATLKTPPVYEYFDCVQKGKHTVESRDGTTKDVPCEWYRCKKHGSGCKVKGSPPIKVVKKATSGLLKHLRICEGEERWLEVRVDSKGSAVFKGTDGALVVKLTFKELLPHHVQFVIYCFRAFDKFSKTRNKDFLAYIEGWEVRARLPARETCIKILFVIKHLVKRRLHSLLSLIKQMLGSPFIGYLDDIWSKVNCKQSFACARIPMAIDGELLDKFLASLFPAHRPQYTGTIVSCSPVLAFSTLPSSRHTGHVIARWKLGTLKDTQVLESKDVSLATEDGASNNKKSNKLLRWPSLVCFPHNLQRCVLIGAGLAGKPCRNAALKKFQARSGKMVGSFSKSGVATAALVEAQIEDDGWDRVLTLASPNVTRWLGLHRQAMRNRELQPNICTALCGDEKGKDSDDEDEDAGAEGLSSSGSEGSGDEDLPRALAVNNNESDESDDGDRIEANVRANKAFPLAHRLLTQSEFTHNAQFESCLVSPAEVSGLLQSHDGLGLEEAQLLMITLAQQTEAPRMQVVSGRGASESWDEVPASRLHQMFKDFRSIFVEEANTRFSLKGTPNEHILLTLKMSPFVDTSPEGPFGKRATQELMQAIYMTKLRARQQYLLSKEAATAAAVPAAAVPATTSGAAASASPSGATPPSAVSASGAAAGSAPKKRQKIGALAMAMHSSSKAAMASSEALLHDEVAAYEKIAATVDQSKYADEDSGRFDLNQFWSDHKKALPIHYHVYLGDCGRKRAASASVETVYSGATKLSTEADHLGDDVLAAYIFLHHNWQFEFLRPTIKEIVDEYQKVHGHQAPQEESDGESDVESDGDGAEGEGEGEEGGE